MRAAAGGSGCRGASRPRQHHHRDPTSRRTTIACSYFVGAAPQAREAPCAIASASARPRRWARQRSLVGGAGKVNRFLSIPPAELATGWPPSTTASTSSASTSDTSAWPWSAATRCRFVHASYTGDQVVTDELAGDRRRDRPLAAPGRHFVSPRSRPRASPTTGWSSAGC
ncbi:MAG: hypothetical protein HS111_01400 [Kofleriaceae bacterium]|nr:hypothetical protein [Kofleriaceae bacterium]